MALFDFHEPVSAITHLAWAMLILPFGTELICSGRDKFSLAIFVCGAFLCYIASFLFHAVNLQYKHFLLIADQICIFFLLAGTYTPMLLHLCNGKARNKLYTVWGLSILGIILRLVMVHKLSEVLYVVIGWGTPLLYWDLLKKTFHKDARLVLVGGMVYTAAAFLEYFRIPNIMSGFGHHEVFHILIMLGTALHYVFMRRELCDGRPKVCD